MIDINKLNAYIMDPDDPIKNYELAMEYYRIKNYSSAGGYLLRAAERSEGDLRYSSVIYLSHVIRYLGDREFTENILLKFLNAIFPERPEAYYHLAKIAERKDSYMDCYMFSKQALDRAKNITNAYGDLEYPGIHEIYFLLGWSAWHTDKPHEARMAYQHILKNYLGDLNEGQKRFLSKTILDLCIDREPNTIIPYDKYNNWQNFIYQFDGKDKITKNHSQFLQDMFVAYALNGKNNGTYLEIGSSYPYYTNNTAVLEECFGWKGIGIEYKEDVVKNYNEHRKNKCLAVDALTVDYSVLLKDYQSTDIDYLQIDLQTSEDAYTVLTKIPFDKYRFAVITFEHDDYTDIEQKYRHQSREFFLNLGYVLAFADVSPVDGFSVEDWWIHPDLVDESRIKSMNKISHIDWSSVDDTEKEKAYQEIQIEKIYKRTRPVKNGDIVVDIGCGVGAFSVEALDKKIKKLYCLDNSESSLEVTKSNTSRMNYNQCSIDYSTYSSFSYFLKEHKIPYIDYLKIDLEGEEYRIFTSENLYYLTHNVQFIVAHFDLRGKDNSSKFKYFRDYILQSFNNVEVVSCRNQNIVPGYSLDLSKNIYNDSFIDNYEYKIKIYINNDRSTIKA